MKQTLKNKNLLVPVEFNRRLQCEPMNAHFYITTLSPQRDQLPPSAATDISFPVPPVNSLVCYLAVEIKASSAFTTNGKIN
jgi:hypothetical protein